MPLQVLIFILLFGLLQGLLIFIILLCRKNIRPFHIFLSAYVIVLLFQIVFKTASKAWLMDVWHPVYSLSYYLPFLYGPIIYFISLSSIKKYKFQPKHLLHFLPFFLFALFFAFDNDTIELPSFLKYLFFARVRLVLQLISLVLYHAAAKKLTSGLKDQVRNIPAPLHFLFVQKFITASLIVSCFISCALCFMYLTHPHYQFLKWSFVLLTFFIYWISLIAFKRPGSFEVVFGKMEADAPMASVKPVLTILPPEVKYVNSGLKDEQAIQIIAALEEAMNVKQLFLDSTITIDKLATLLSCQKHHLSQALNDKLGVSFNEYINRKRTEAAKQMLADPGKNHYTIASVAYDAGFNSLSTFNEVFKKIAGLTPSQYRKMGLKESQQQRI